MLAHVRSSEQEEKRSSSTHRLTNSNWIPSLREGHLLDRIDFEHILGAVSKILNVKVCGLMPNLPSSYE